MAKEDQLLDLMSKGEGSEDSMPDGDMGAGPLGAPMTTPQENEGDKAEATAKVALAMKLLEQSLTPFGAESKEGSAIVDSMTKLAKTFKIRLDEGEKMIPAELKMLMESATIKTPEIQAAQAGTMPPAPMLKAA